MHRYFFLLLALCVIWTEAFTVISIKGARNIPLVVLQQTSFGRYSRGLLPTSKPSLSLSSPSSLLTSMNLFPFSRKKTEDTKLNKRNNEALKGRISGPDDTNGEDENEEKEIKKRRPRVDDLVQLVSLRMRRVTFLSWWAQLILTVISSVTLIFTRYVMNLETTRSVTAAATAATNRALVPNYFLAGSSIAISFGSVFWTWATRRLSRRLLRKPTTRSQAANMLRKSISVGTYLNLIGMLLALLGAGQIIGSLAIKVLTTATNQSTIYQQGGVMLLQPLDILVVQANNNTLFSHFCSLVAYLFLGRSIGQLDPPSVDEDERSRA